MRARAARTECIPPRSRRRALPLAHRAQRRRGGRLRGEGGASPRADESKTSASPIAAAPAVPVPALGRRAERRARAVRGERNVAARGAERSRAIELALPLRHLRRRREQRARARGVARASRAAGGSARAGSSSRRRPASARRTSRARCAHEARPRRRASSTPRPRPSRPSSRAAIRGRDTTAFKRRFRQSCDLLVLEDVQFFARQGRDPARAVPHARAPARRRHARSC